MKRHQVITKDQSPTLFVPELNEHYHSIHGALAESLHVFIEAGLKALNPNNGQLAILEMGFGTGLNAWLTLTNHSTQGVDIQYHGIEKYPLNEEEFSAIQYKTDDPSFLLLHQSPWQQWHPINAHFKLFKDQVDLINFKPNAEYDLVYFDAFAPSAQPQLWSIDIFQKIYHSMKPGGIMVTYCVKGDVRRNMKAAGFSVEKIPGPPGKREMARARKPLNH